MVLKNGQATCIKRLTIALIDKIQDITQLRFTCLKSTIETLEKGMKYVQS